MIVTINQRTDNTYAFTSKAIPFKYSVKPEVEKQLGVKLGNVNEINVASVIAITTAYVNNELNDECFFEYEG